MARYPAAIKKVKGAFSRNPADLPKFQTFIPAAICPDVRRLSNFASTCPNSNGQEGLSLFFRLLKQR
jgi:hypothetical protein